MPINIRLHITITFLFVLLLTQAISAQAQIRIEEQQQAELPLALIPSSRQKIILKTNGGLGGNTNADIVGGHAMSGHYKVYSDSDSDSNISINILSNEDDPHIKLKSFKVVYKGVTYKNFPVVGLSSPGNGEDIHIGFTAISFQYDFLA